MWPGRLHSVGLGCTCSTLHLPSSVFDTAPTNFVLRCTLLYSTVEYVGTALYNGDPRHGLTLNLRLVLKCSTLYLIEGYVV